jgi:DNA modification methylase
MPFRVCAEDGAGDPRISSLGQFMARTSNASHPALAIEYAPIASLKAAAYNPRQITPAELHRLERSIGQFGLVDPVIARREDSEVIGGHQRLIAAKSVGLTTAPVIFIDGLSDEQARLLNLALNRISGEWDTDKLGRLLLELGALPDLDLSLSGFDGREIARNISLHLRERPGLSDEEELPPLPREPIARLGDRWQLGDHLLFCGDARKVHAVPPGTVDVLWTDPPYGVSYIGRTKRQLTIRGDEDSGVARLLRRTFTNIDTFLRPGARIYVCHPAGQLSVVFGQEFLRAGWRLHQTLVWVKDSMVLGRSDYHYRHEPILYGYKPGKGRAGRGGAGWYGDNRRSSVFEIPRPKASRDHPTTKPVQLIEAHLLNSSAPGDVVLDPFLGSGSTLIACEKLGRRCVGVELDPRFVDVAVQRWERFTGREAERL